MKIFQNLIVESKPYPSVIMGEDNFTGWFGKGNYKNEVERKKSYERTLEVAYSQGVRGFSMSPHLVLMDALYEFKQKNADIICIANPHWQCNYYLDDESLWSEKNLKRIQSTISSANSEMLSKDFFRRNHHPNSFSQDEIDRFWLKEDEYQQWIDRFKLFCEFCIVGNLSTSALLLLNRVDIIENEIDIIRQNGLIPIGICENMGYALKRIEQLNISICWGRINHQFAYPNLQMAFKSLKHTKKYITAYNIFGDSIKFDLMKSIKFLNKIPSIQSIVVGVDFAAQAMNTFSNLKHLFNYKPSQKKILAQDRGGAKI